MLPAVMLVAIVIDPGTFLRAAPKEQAVRQAPLQRGDWLEVRGEKQGFVQVYDHRRERPGYVKATQVRSYAINEEAAPSLHAVIDFLKDTPGNEALGIGYVALYVRAAPSVGSDVYDALGGMADRLARRASAQKVPEVSLGADLDVAQSYGVKFVGMEAEGRTQLCYDGEAYRRVLAMASTDAERIRAALMLTRRQCVAADTTPLQERTWNEWRADVLSKVQPGNAPQHLANRLHLRRVEVLSELTFGLARAGEMTLAAKNAEGAVNSLARIQKAELTDDDRTAYEHAAIRAGVARQAMESVATSNSDIQVEIVPKADGQTCVRVQSSERCTYALVWPGSVVIAPKGTAVTVAVQPLAGWSELWVFRPKSGGWQQDVLLPAGTDPVLGYVEMAGASPDGKHLLVVREAVTPTGLRRDFQELSVDTLRVEHMAHGAEGFRPFTKWSSPRWKGATLAAR